MELKPVVIAKDGVAKIGNDIINLTDRSVNVFKTLDIMAFIQFMTLFFANTLAEAKTTVAIFYDLTTLILKDMTGFKGQEPIATCRLETHPILNLITSAVNSKMSMERLDEFLFILRPFYEGPETQELYDRLQKFSVKKIENIVREKDRQGNYVYACSIKDDSDSPEFPAVIKFACPVFKGIETRHIDIPLELFIDFQRDEQNKPSISFTLKNPLINMRVEQRGREIIEEYLHEIHTVPKLYGSLDTVEKNDSWKYQINKI